MKIEILKKGILDMREVLKRYVTLIPLTQKPRYEKDIAMIFNNFDSFEHDESGLSKMDKLAKTKLKSIQRIYGELREETKSDTRSVSLIDDETEEYFKKFFNVDPKAPFKPKFKEMKNSAEFNPIAVKNYQEHYKEERKRIEEAYTTVMQEKADANFKKSQHTIQNILIQGKDMDLTKCRDKDGNLVKAKLKEAVKEVMRMNGYEDADQRAEDFDYNEIIFSIEGSEENNQLKQNTQIINDAQKNNFTDVSKSEQLFSVFNQSKDMSEEEYNKFLEKATPILNDPNLNEDEKREKYIKELKKSEDEWNMNNLDGVISYDKYGELKFKFFKNEKLDTKDGEESIENIDKEKEKKKENEISNLSNSSNEPESEINNNTGTKTFVWRDGKLVEGKAQERKVVTYSNWHAGHHNPDDLRKHRELLDRQHYGGPLWDGIKYVGNLSQGQTEVVVTGPTREDLENMEKNKINYPEKEGKKEIIEIVR